MYYPFGYDHYISRLKASKDGNLPALMQAKDQAMVEALAAVPKPERHQTRQLSADEAYLEWKLGLAAEPMLKVADEAWEVYNRLTEAEYELACERLRSVVTECCGDNSVIDDTKQISIAMNIDDAKHASAAINVDNTKQTSAAINMDDTNRASLSINTDDTQPMIEYNKLKEDYEKICEEWTLECLKWYDVYLDETVPSEG